MTIWCRWRRRPERTRCGTRRSLGGTEITTDTTGTTLTDATRFYKTGTAAVASRNLAGALSWLANDDQNTANVAIDAGTLAVVVRRQDPFGNPRGTPPAWPNSRGFVGGTTEPTGLIHLGARMYDPGNGRFVSDDEVTDTNNPQQLNGYAYAYNSPLTYSDPTGLWGWKSVFKAVANVASVASIIPGPIGMIASAVSAVSYAAAGDYANAAIMTAGILLSAVGAGAAVLAVKAARIIRATRAIRSGGRALEEAERGATSAMQAARHSEHLRQLEKYGKAGHKELQGGRIRYYGKITPAKKQGEMAGMRMVREWNPANGRKREFFETVDHAGRTRQVRIAKGNQKVHYVFNQHGRYTGKWSTRCADPTPWENITVPPSREEVRNKLIALLRGQAAREDVAAWAHDWFTTWDGVRISDEAVLDALHSLVMAGEQAELGEYFYSDADFHDWLAALGESDA